MAGKDAGLDYGEKTGGDIPAGDGVSPGLGFPVLPSAENRGAAVVGETYGSSAQNLEVFAADLAAVEQGETEPVGEDGAELLHEVEGECGFSGTQAVEVADVGSRPTCSAAPWTRLLSGP